MNEKLLVGPLSQLWQKYSAFVENATKGNTEVGSENIIYWRDRLFTLFITWLLPVCLIALIPGVTMGIIKGYPVISVVDLASAFSIFAIALSPPINLFVRKVFVVAILYILAAVLMVFLGVLGPAFIYLLTLSVFITLTFPKKYAYYSVAANLLICAGCGILIYFKLFNSPLVKQFDLGIWIAVCSNLIFLSLVCVVLICYLIKGLEDTVLKEFRLKNQLQVESKERLRNNLLLRESEGHYKSLFFLSPSPMWVLDSETFRFLQVNEAAIKTYGYSNSDFLTMSVDDIKTEGQIVDAFVAKHDHHLQEPSRAKIFQHKRKNGEVFYVEISFNSIPFKGKIGILGIARDMTEQMNYIQAIEDQNNKLHEIAYIQSHVVRAPLARIIGLCNLIKTCKDGKPTAEMLEYLEHSANEFDEVIKNITSKTEQIFIN